MEPSGRSISKLPKQAEPVQRNLSSVVQSNEQGVEASLASNIWNVLRLYG